jgi:hypothetical protein
MNENPYQKFFCLSVLILFPAVVVRHGDNGQNQIDQVERTHKDDDDKERHVKRTVCFNNLQVRKVTTCRVNAAFCSRCLQRYVIAGGQFLAQFLFVPFWLWLREAEGVAVCRSPCKFDCPTVAAMSIATMQSLTGEYIQNLRPKH